ncbi:hypothetical protein [Blastopirellula marina]|uniref:Uncharacterized protein n=1 Tax=Blastopirellula marina DSM 3645 TaxID=314230 RepID=A3ZPH5_9BACT|nr:hypothetical protein [Blastopirellula marina]EAQ81653.1 hypothetical protein DSM3645_28767 [Blastopirellula marina DSM 3645]
MLPRRTSPTSPVDESRVSLVRQRCLLRRCTACRRQLFCTIPIDCWDGELLAAAADAESNEQCAAETTQFELSEL